MQRDHELAHEILVISKWVREIHDEIVDRRRWSPKLSSLESWFAPHIGNFVLAAVALLAVFVSGTTIIGTHIRNARIDRIEKGIIDTVEQTVHSTVSNVWRVDTHPKFESIQKSQSKIEDALSAINERLTQLEASELAAQALRNELDELTVRNNELQAELAGYKVKP